MKKSKPGWYLGMALLAFLASGAALADWLAVDPGTKISLQVNSNGTLVVRPIGGTWSHPLCTDVTAAVVVRQYVNYDKLDSLLKVLTAAAAEGSLVNLYALPDTCHSNGYPVITSVRIQAP